MTAPTQLPVPTRGHLPPVARRQICTGKTLGDGVPARCGDAAVHGQHPIGGRS